MNREKPRSVNSVLAHSQSLYPSSRWRFESVLTSLEWEPAKGRLFAEVVLHNGGRGRYVYICRLRGPYTERALWEVDAMIPIGRGQRELSVDDLLPLYPTGKKMKLIISDLGALQNRLYSADRGYGFLADNFGIEVYAVGPWDMVPSALVWRTEMVSSGVSGFDGIDPLEQDAFFRKLLGIHKIGEGMYLYHRVEDNRCVGTRYRVGERAQVIRKLIKWYAASRRTDVIHVFNQVTRAADDAAGLAISKRLIARSNLKMPERGWTGSAQGSSPRKGIWQGGFNHSNKPQYTPEEKGKHGG